MRFDDHRDGSTSTTYVAGPEGFAAVGADGSLRFRLALDGLERYGSVALGYERTTFVVSGSELIAIG